MRSFTPHCALALEMNILLFLVVHVNNINKIIAPASTAKEAEGAPQIRGLTHDYERDVEADSPHNERDYVFHIIFF